jgi:hypothetical protein
MIAIVSHQQSSLLIQSNAQGSEKLMQLATLTITTCDNLSLHTSTCPAEHEMVERLASKHGHWRHFVFGTAQLSTELLCR